MILEGEDLRIWSHMGQRTPRGETQLVQRLRRKCGQLDTLRGRQCGWDAETWGRSMRRSWSQTMQGCVGLVRGQGYASKSSGVPLNDFRQRGDVVWFCKGHGGCRVEGRLEEVRGGVRQGNQLGGPCSCLSNR